MTDFLEGRPWMQTATGRAFPLVDPQPSDVHWPDIAYGLAHANRFAGAAGVYTVAQHSTWPLLSLPYEWRPHWLLHDAHEFATGDITRPAQQALATYAAGGIAAAIAAFKRGIDSAIYQAAGLTWPVPQEIRDAIHVVDARMLATEVRDLLLPKPAPWGYEHVPPYNDTIVPVDAAEAYDLFGCALKVYLGLTLPAMSNIGKSVEQENHA